MGINWSQIEREKFDDIVEALFRRMYIRAEEFVVFNGRGGDGGRDIVVRLDGVLTVYQLKYFPEGFSSAWRQRRSQIKSSFETALKHEPDEWCLVVPCNLTDGEQHYVRGLLGKGKRKPRVRWFGETELNDELAQRPDIVSYFNRNESLEKAQIYNREVDFLAAGSADVFERVRALGGVVDDVDLNWTLDFSREGDSVVQMIRAKHPWSQEVSPISINFTAAFDPDDVELEASFKRVVGYGVAEPLEFPVSHFEIVGPPLVSHVAEDAIVKMVTIEPDSNHTFPFQISFTGEDGQVLGSHTGVAIRAGQAHLGRSITTVFHDALTLTFLMPVDVAQPGQVQMELDLRGAHPSTVLKVNALLTLIDHAANADLKLNGDRFASADIRTTASSRAGVDLEEWERYCGLAEDLDIVQRHCDVYFPMPDEVGGQSRLFVRAARLLIEGQCVAVPDHRRLTARLNGTDGDSIRDFLSGKGMLLLDQERFGFEIFDQRLIIGHARTYGTNATVVNADAAVAALDAGRAKDFKITILPGDADSFWTFLVDKYQGTEWPKPVGWALKDFADPPDAVPRALE